MWREWSKYLIVILPLLLSTHVIKCYMQYLNFRQHWVFRIWDCYTRYRIKTATELWSLLLRNMLRYDGGDLYVWMGGWVYVWVKVWSWVNGVSPRPPPTPTGYSQYSIFLSEMDESPSSMEEETPSKCRWPTSHPCPWSAHPRRTGDYSSP